MEKLTGLCVLLAALSLAVTEDKYFTDGGSITLDVRPSYPDPIKTIVWKFRGDLLVEWIEDKVPVEFSRSFKGRSTLDTENGRLVVNSMSKNDMGVYSVEINNIQSVSYTAKWIKSVPQPVVVITCAASSEVCTVSCDGDTTGAEPVTYRWNIGDRELLGKDRKITDTKNGHDKLITCWMTNPLSEKVSEIFNNPFYKEELDVLMIVMIVFLLIVVVVLCILAKKQKEELTFRRRRQLIVDGLIWLAWLHADGSPNSTGRDWPSLDCSPNWTGRDWPGLDWTEHWTDRWPSEYGKERGELQLQLAKTVDTSWAWLEQQLKTGARCSHPERWSWLLSQLKIVDNRWGSSWSRSCSQLTARSHPK